MAVIERRGLGQWRVKIRKKDFPLQTKTFTTKKNAEAWARKVQSEMEQGTFICSKEAQRTSLREALGRYVREVSVDKKGRAQELQRIAIWQRHSLAEKSLASLRGADFAAYRDERVAAGKSSNTIRLELAIISHLFTVARKEWGMESLGNPVQMIRMPKPSASRDRRLEDGEIERLLEGAAQAKSRGIMPIIEIALETAARRGEIAAMRWEHINLKKKTWHIPETKNSTPRTVPLSTRAIGVLQCLPRKISGSVWGMAEDSITQAFGRVCQQVEIEGLHFHDLRHEFSERYKRCAKCGSLLLQELPSNATL